MDEFLIQVGRYKGSYKTKYKFNTLTQAWLWYKAINIGNGYKKRLVHNSKVTWREFS
jgi:hypothetical protein